MSDLVKYMDIKEFRKKGYLQELNRRFLHPLGLAMEVLIDDDGNETLGGVWDYRDDKEGIIYNLDILDIDRVIKFKERKEFIDLEIEKYKKNRIDILGYEIEPINVK